MADNVSSVVKRPLHAWVLGKNKWLQLVLVLVAVTAAGANVLPLEMQKRIVDDAIKAGKLELLLWYGGIYLAAVTGTTLLKYLIGVLQTVIAQRTLCRMRCGLFGHILTLPAAFYRSTQPGLVVSALSKELAVAGEYAGAAVAVPVTNLLLLAAFGVYLVQLNVALAVVSLSIYPLVFGVVPFLQKRVNAYNEKRIDQTRRMSSKIGEAVDGITEIQVNAAFAFEGDAFHGLARRLKRIRLVWNAYRLAVKRVNSLFTNIGRFLVFTIGGYLTIKGQMELGALVAFLSAQEKLYDPWKELIAFYQAHQIAHVTYNRTMDYFDACPEHPIEPVDREAHRLDGHIAATDVGVVTPQGAQLLSGVEFSLERGDHLAVVGFSGSGKSTLADCVAQLQTYTSGRIQIDRKEVSQMSKADIAGNIGYVSQTPFIFSGTLNKNLVYGVAALRHSGRRRERQSLSLPGLDERILVLQQSGLFKDVIRFGLGGVLDPAAHRHMIEPLLSIRETLHRRYKPDLTPYIEFYEWDDFLLHSSLARNILFGEATCPSFDVDNLPGNPVFRETLQEVELTPPLIELGRRLTRQAIKRARDPDDENRRQARAPLDPSEIATYEELFYRLRGRETRRLADRHRDAFLRIALRYVPAEHGPGHVSQELAGNIIEARKVLADKMARRGSEKIAACRLSTYLYSQSILTNILYGKIRDQSDAAGRDINTLIHRVLIETEYLEDIVEMGMAHQVGSKGENLSGGQRQKLAIARAFLKDPPILIMDEATSGLDNESQARIQHQIETVWHGKSTLIAVVHRLDTIRNFDRIAVMKGGRIVESGTYDELMQQQGALFELVDGNAST